MKNWTWEIGWTECGACWTPRELDLLEDSESDVLDKCPKSRTTVDGRNQTNENRPHVGDEVGEPSVI